MEATRHSIARNAAAVLGGAALLIACVSAGAVRADASARPAGTISIGQPAAATPSTAPSLTKPCAFTDTAACASLNPKASLYINVSGDASTCSTTWDIDWGDGGKAETVVTDGGRE